MKNIIVIAFCLGLTSGSFAQINTEVYKGKNMGKVVSHKSTPIVVKSQPVETVQLPKTSEANVILRTTGAEKKVVKPTPKPEPRTTVIVSGLTLKNSKGKNADDLDDIYGVINAEFVDDKGEIIRETRLMYVDGERATVNMEETPIYEMPGEFGAGDITEKFRRCKIRLQLRLFDKDANCDWGKRDEWGKGDDDIFFFVNETVTERNSGGIMKVIPINSLKEGISTVVTRLYNGSDFLDVCINVEKKSN